MAVLKRPVYQILWVVGKQTLFGKSFVFRYAFDDLLGRIEVAGGGVEGNGRPAGRPYGAHMKR
jgi:hypothetical protein